jgi:AAA domain-containing protein
MAKTNADTVRASWRDHVFTAAQLQRQIFPPVSYCVPQLIPEGLTMIAGKPKIGKSWLALDVCIAVAAGRPCLGDRKPAQGDVLYAAMEDNPRRLQRRIDRLLSPFSAEWPERLTLANSWHRLDKGGVNDIRQWIEHAAEPRLVVLDTLASVKPIRTQQGYTEDYESLAELHRLANDKGTSIILLHHTRKMEADDPVDTVSGTLGLAGCADSVLILSRSSQGTTLYVRGRDIEEAEHAITFDNIGCRWSILGNAADVHRSNERGKILVVLLNATELLGPQQIADRAKMKSDNVRYLLGQMTESGEVMKAARGRYHHPDRSELSEDPSQALHPHNLGETVQFQSVKPGCEVVSNVRGPHKSDCNQANGGGRGPRCDHCGREQETPSDPVLECWCDGVQAWLHRNCRDDWRKG